MNSLNGSLYARPLTRTLNDLRMGHDNDAIASGMSAHPLRPLVFLLLFIAVASALFWAYKGKADSNAQDHVVSKPVPGSPLQTGLDLGPAGINPTPIARLTEAMPLPDAANSSLQIRPGDPQTESKNADHPRNDPLTKSALVSSKRKASTNASAQREAAIRRPDAAPAEMPQFAFTKEESAIPQAPPTAPSPTLLAEPAPQ